MLVVVRPRHIGMVVLMPAKSHANPRAYGRHALNGYGKRQQQAGNDTEKASGHPGRFYVTSFERYGGCGFPMRLMCRRGHSGRSSPWQLVHQVLKGLHHALQLGHFGA